jgi:thiol:disulfide interchange protein
VNVRTIVCSFWNGIAAIGCHKSGELDVALKDARTAHKQLMVEFGADWCSDCKQLARDLQHEPIKNCLRESFNVFRVDVGEFNRNLDIASGLGIDIKNGVIPTAVFFPPANAAWTTKVGTHEILAFLKQSCSATRSE